MAAWKEQEHIRSKKGVFAVFLVAINPYDGLAQAQAVLAVTQTPSDFFFCKKLEQFVCNYQLQASHFSHLIKFIL